MSETLLNFSKSLNYAFFLNLIQSLNYVEFFGVIFGLICVWLTVRRNIWCWPTGLVNAALFVILFFQARLYADMALNVYFFVMSLYGWYAWLYGGPAKDELPISRTGRDLALILFALGVVSVLAMGFFLSSFTKADLPFWDSTTTTLSLIAQFMLARKLLENWLVWIVNDVLCIGIYFYKELYFLTGLYFVFLVLATAGYISWRRTAASDAEPGPETGAPFNV